MTEMIYEPNKKEIPKLFKCFFPSNLQMTVVLPEALGFFFSLVNLNTEQTQALNHRIRPMWFDCTSVVTEHSLYIPFN